MAGSSESLAIPIRSGLNLQSAFEFLSMRAVRGIENVTNEHYARSFRLEGAPAVISVKRAVSGESLAVTFWGRVDGSAIREVAVRLFDLDVPTARIKRHLGSDSVLGEIVASHPSILLPAYIDPFEGVVRAIVGQLISVKAARTVVARMVEAFGGRLERAVGGVSHLFPDTKTLACLKAKDLKALGLTSAKASAICGVAEAVCSGDLDFAALAAADSKTAERALRRLFGVGPWTASIIQMEVFHDVNAFPAGDLGVVKALAQLTKSRRLGKEQLAQFHQSWSPWGAYATLYLWKHLDAMAAGPCARRRTALSQRSRSVEGAWRRGTDGSA